jgi:exonuclease III
MALAMKTMKQVNINVGILTETSLREGMFPQNAHGYTIVATEGQNKYQGVIALFYQSENNKFIIEGTKAFGPNAIRTILASGERIWTIIGCYIPLRETTLETLNYIQMAVQYNMNDKIILLGEPKVNLNKLTNANNRQEETAALLASIGLEDLQ